MRLIIWITVFLILFLGIFGLLHLFYVSPNVTITKENVKVVRTEMHPFLIDHKKLIVVDIKGRRIDEEMGYSDSGIGCDSHLFEDETKFILFECNGTRFEIAKQGGKIERTGWTWMEKLPVKYVGVFKRQDGNIEYSLSDQSYPELRDIYRFKDPVEDEPNEDLSRESIFQ